MKALLRAAILCVFSGLAVFANSVTFTVNCTNGVVTATDTAFVVACLLPGGGSYTGNVDVVETGSLVLVKMTGGSFTGSSTGIGANGNFDPIVSAPYFLLGEGIEQASFGGTLGIAGDTTNGLEFFDEAVYGTSFDAGPESASWDGPAAGIALPIPVGAGPNTVNGDFTGSGTAELFVRYDTGGGTAYTFPTSVDGELAVPEPSSLLLLASGLLGLGGGIRRKLRC